LLPPVNAILGLPFITQTKMIIDPSNQVEEMRAFDTPPFPTNFHCAMCAVPIIDDASVATNVALHSNILRVIKSIKEHIKKVEHGSSHMRENSRQFACQYPPPTQAIPGR
jgi:hypothetical protein